MLTVIFQHEVTDFKEWRKAFDADEPNRAKAGLQSIGLFTSVHNPNDVTFIFEAPNAEILDAMMANPDFQATMKNAGVISVPVVKMYNKV
jgi:quinol monooxygenase YgiN